MFHVIQFTTSQCVVFGVLCILSLAAMFFVGEIIGLLVAHDPHDWSLTNCPNPKLSKTELIHRIAEKFRDFTLSVESSGREWHLDPWACGALAQLAADQLNEYLMMNGIRGLKEDKIEGGK
jgi:hypothetical protein